MKNIIEFLNTNSGVAMLISSISTLISAVAVVVAFYFNAKTQKQYKRGLEPQLTMHLDRLEGMLFLRVQNNGKIAANNINIKINSIEGNADYKLSVDKAFDSFELYPNEVIQGEVAISAESMATGRLYPVISIDVSYQVNGIDRKRCYSRTITFSRVFGQKILADVNMDLRNIESMIAAMAKAEVRTANYLDGHQVAVLMS